MRFTITFEGRIVDGDPGSLAAHLDAVMDEFLALGVEDPAIGAGLTAGEVEISVSVEAPGLEEALKSGGAIIRSAIHAAGGATPDWAVNWVKAHARRADLVEA